MERTEAAGSEFSRHYRFADLRLDVGQRRLFRDKSELQLSKLSFEFLLALVESAPNLVTHDKLGTRVWGSGRIITPENLAKRALILRNSVGDHADHPRYFEAIRGQGYRLIPPVTRTSISSEESDSAIRHSRLRPGVVAITALSIGLMAIAAALAFRQSVPALPAAESFIRFELTPDHQYPLVRTSYVREVAISHDGTTLAYLSAENSIIVRSLNELEFRRILNLGTDTRAPAFSHDGSYIAYLDGGALKRISAEGSGTAKTLASVGQFTDGDLSWTPDGDVLVASSRGIVRVPGDGGSVETLLRPDPAEGELAYSSPSMLSDGRGILFSVTPTEPAVGTRVAIFELDSERKTYLLSNATQPTWLSSGHVTYVSDRQLRSASLDLITLSVRNDYVVLAENVSVHSSGSASVSVADDGSHIYIAGEPTQDRELIWVDRHGLVEPLESPIANFTYPRLSPNGTHILLDVRWPESDIWVWDLERDLFTRLTNNPAENVLPVWHPDGRQMAFGDGRDGFANVYWQHLNSGRPPERLTEGANRQLPFSISPNGRYLLIGGDQEEGNWNMWALDLEKRSQEPLLTGPYSFWNAEISPDGHWLVYQSNESGSLETFVRPFPDTAAGRWQISQGGGVKPMWSRDGTEIFYISPRGGLVAVAVSTTPEFTLGTQKELFDIAEINRLAYETGARPYDLSPDGQRFLLTRPAGSSHSETPEMFVGLSTGR